MAPLTQTAFRLDQEDFDILDEVKRRTGLAARSDALRYVLRQYAQQQGIGDWGPSKKVGEVRRRPAEKPKPKRSK
jgi:hypothetical protein